MARERSQNISIDFKVVVSREGQGSYLARCPTLPGLVATGRAQKEALDNIERAILEFLEFAAPLPFLPVCRDAAHPRAGVFGVFRGELYCATSHDAVYRTSSGDFGSWLPLMVTKTTSAFYNSLSVTEGNEASSGDYTPQVYALETFTAFGTERLFAGTNAMGGIYESEDGKRWKLNFSSGEERVHSLCCFGRKLYAGTSSRGAIYSYNGRSWGVAYATGEVAVTALCAHGDHIYAGTYPGGYIFRSRDGLKWDLAYRSRQSFIHDFAANEEKLYACGGRADGAKIFRLASGGRWETVYRSDREQNVYCLVVFNGSIYAGCGEGGRLLRSLDGRKWETAFQSGQEGIRGMGVFEGRLYLATERGGVVFRSESSEAAPPQIARPEVGSVTSCSAEVSWTTDKPTYSTLEYGTGSTTEFTYACRELKREHRMLLSGLKAGATYRLRARSDLASGNLSVSPEAEFSTQEVSPPQVSSASHAEPVRWYSKNRLEFTVLGVSGASGYVYALDRKKDYQPGADDSRGDKAPLVIERVEDGEWYLHLRGVDAAGNLSAKTHRRMVRVDTKAEEPELISSSHPRQDTWYAKNELRFEWRVKGELSGVKGYYYLLDQESRSLPGEKHGEWTDKKRAGFSGVADGIWYFHIVAVDESGNVSDEAAHYEVRVDTIAPQPRLESKSHPQPEKWYSENRLDVSWSCELDLSGIAGYYHHLDREAKGAFDEKEWKWLTAENASLTIKKDGEWFFHVCAKDKAGNIGLVAHRAVRLDRTCPAPTLSSPSHADEKGWYNSPKAALEWEEPPNLSGVEGYYYQLVPGPRSEVPGPSSGEFEKQGWTFTADTSCEVELPEEGEWYFYLVARDKAGNLSARPVHYRIGVDRGVGKAEISSPSHDDQEGWYNLRKAEMKWTGPEDVAGIKGYYYRLSTSSTESQVHSPKSEGLKKEGWTFTEERSCQLEFKEAGQWVFELLAEDGAGNIGREAAVYALATDYECAAPRLSSPSHSERGRWYSLRDAVLSWEEPEDSAGIRGYHYRLVPSPESSVPRPEKAGNDDWKFTKERQVKVRVPEDGEWCFEIQAEDVAGNKSGTASHPLLIDTETEPPTLESPGLLEAEDWHTSNTPLVVIKPPQERSGVAGYYYLVDGEAGTVPDAGSASWTGEDEVRLGPLEDGVWYLHVLTRDGAGNTSKEAAHLRLRIDCTPPSATVNPLPKFTRERNFLVSWSGQDALSGLKCFDVQVREDEGGDYSDWLAATERGEETYRSSGSGFYYFRCRAQDQAGNWGPYDEHGSNTARIGVDLEPPEAVMGLEAELKLGGEVRLTWRPAADEISGTAYYSVYRSGKADDLGRMISVPGQVRETMFLDPGRDLREAEKYYYTVQAVDGVGNECTEDNQRIAVVCDKMADLPQVTSPTHHSSERWYSARKAVFRFKAGANAEEVDGYYYLLDREPDTELDAENGRFTESLEVELKAEVDGTHYFHLLPRYGAGSPGRLTVHFRLNIDGEPPGKPEVKREISATGGETGNIELSFAASDYLSGLEGYYFIVDGRKEGAPSFSGSQWTESGRAILSRLEPGRHYVHVVAVDKAGNASAPAHFSLDVASEEAGVISGNVYSYDGESAASGELTLEGEGKKETARVTGSGSFTFPGLRPGRYRLTWKVKKMPDLVIDHEQRRPGGDHLAIYEELMLWPAVVSEDSFLLIFYEAQEGALLLETYDAAGKLMGKREFVKEGGVYHKILCDTARYPDGDYVLRLSARSAEDGRLLRVGQRVFSVRRKGK